MMYTCPQIRTARFFYFCAAHLLIKLDIETKFLISYLNNHVKNKKYGNFVFISSLTGKCAAQKFKNFCSSSPFFYECMGKKYFCFFQTAETGKRAPNSLPYSLPPIACERNFTHVNLLLYM